MYAQKIWGELLAQLELSSLLHEGLLGWAKVVELSDQNAHIYFPTTLEFLEKVTDNIADFPDRLQQTIAEIEKFKAGKQKAVVDGLKQYYTELLTLKNQATKLASIGKQTSKDEEGVFLLETAQELIGMATSMAAVSDNLRNVLEEMKREQ